MKKGVNLEIALTHILSRKKQTLVASLGVTVGITAFVFLNSLILGFNRFFDGSIFKSMPHMRIYKDDEISKSLASKKDSASVNVVINPKILNKTKNLINPQVLVNEIKHQPDVVAAAQWVTVNLFYISGKSQLNGVASGANIHEADAMFDITSTMIEGDVQNLESVTNGILIGVGIAEKLNIRLNENLTVISSLGASKVMKVVGIFKTSNSITDKTKSYMNLAAAQQLLREGPSYVTDIYVNIKEPQKVTEYKPLFEKITGYKIEDWKEANETFVAAGKTRSVMMRSISAAILLVAAFGIYNILNMTIMQKLNDIAILKATGFSGKDVVKIFVGEAMIMGTFGTCIGLGIATILVNLVSHVYVGGDIGFFPIRFESSIMALGAFVGILVTTAAGFIPARNAAKVDPVEIFRK
ncbi:MAG TPA: FtsX-like permease family protein [Bacteroidia bacterium]|jgi:lipoprotein-releasing system permease protein|nr:FtsX-like permease family protein [Bacteroidia bacterium]